MLLMNEENAINVKPETVSAPETEISQADLIELLQKENQELARQLSDTRYKLNQTEIENKELQKTVRKIIQARNGWMEDYHELLDKILDRVNRKCDD